jgi:phosphoribosylaminoimidazole-succinocarboxamide synthase
MEKRQQLYEGKAKKVFATEDPDFFIVRYKDDATAFNGVKRGTIVLADEISPDTCRLWDTATGEKLDKDRFRRDLGGVEDAYREILRRMESYDA